MLNLSLSLASLWCSLLMKKTAAVFVVKNLGVSGHFGLLGHFLLKIINKNSKIFFVLYSFFMHYF